MSVTGLTLRCRRGWFLPEAPGEKLCPCLFWLPEAACIPWLVVLLPLSQPQARPWGLRFHGPSLTLPSFKDSCDYTGFTGMIGDHLPTSGSLTSSHLQSPFCEVTYPQVIGIRTWTSLETMTRSTALPYALILLFPETPLFHIIC